MKGYGSIDALIELIRTAAYTDQGRSLREAVETTTGLNAIDVECGPTVRDAEAYEVKSKEKSKKMKRKPKQPQGFPIRLKDKRELKLEVLELLLLKRLARMAEVGRRWRYLSMVKFQ